MTFFSDWHTSKTAKGCSLCGVMYSGSSMVLWIRQRCASATRRYTLLSYVCTLWLNSGCITTGLLSLSHSTLIEPLRGPGVSCGAHASHGQTLAGEVMGPMGWSPCLGLPQLSGSARNKARNAPLQMQRLFPPHPASFNFALSSSAGRCKEGRRRHNADRWHRGPTISLGFVTSVRNLKRQEIHLYRASRSGPVQLYGIPCIGPRQMPFFSLTWNIRIPHAAHKRPRQTRAAREKVGRETRNHLRREYHSPVVRHRRSPYLR